MAKRHKDGSIKLTARQLRFVEEYLVDLNATRAARAAGYREKTAYASGAENLKKPQIAAAIQKAQQARSTRTGITQDRVLTELEHVAFSSIDDYIVDESGRVVLREGAPASALKAVASVKHKHVTKEVGKMVITERETELKLWDKPSTLRMAGRHIGLFPDRLDVGAGGGPGGRLVRPEDVQHMSDAELLALAKEQVAALEKEVESKRV